MKPWPLAFGVLLVGTGLLLFVTLPWGYEAQARQNATCRTETDEYFAGHKAPTETAIYEHTVRTHLCMQRSGYQASDDLPCPFGQNLQYDRFQVVDSMRSTDPLCYIPMGWATRQYFLAQVWLLKLMKSPMVARPGLTPPPS